MWKWIPQNVIVAMYEDRSFETNGVWPPLDALLHCQDICYSIGNVLWDNSDTKGKIRRGCTTKFVPRNKDYCAALSKGVMEAWVPASALMQTWEKRILLRRQALSTAFLFMRRTAHTNLHKTNTRHKIQEFPPQVTMRVSNYCVICMIEKIWQE